MPVDRGSSVSAPDKCQLSKIGEAAVMAGDIVQVLGLSELALRLNVAEAAILSSVKASDFAGNPRSGADRQRPIRPAAALRIALEVRLRAAGIAPRFAKRIAGWAVTSAIDPSRQAGAADNPGRSPDRSDLRLGGLVLEVADGRYVRMRRAWLGHVREAGRVRASRHRDPGPRELDVSWTWLSAHGRTDRPSPDDPDRALVLITVELGELEAVLAGRRSLHSPVANAPVTIELAGAAEERLALRRAVHGLVETKLSDEEWELVRPLLPSAHTGRPPTVERRMIIDAILYRRASGIPWRYLPPGFPKWTAVQSSFRRWRGDGTMDAIDAVLRRPPERGGLRWSIDVPTHGPPTV